MKTLDKIIKEHKKYLINNGIADWNEKDTKLVAITYASQSVDRCAEVAYKRTGEFIADELGDSILSLKSELR